MKLNNLIGSHFFKDTLISIIDYKDPIHVVFITITNERNYFIFAMNYRYEIRYI